MMLLKPLFWESKLLAWAVLPHLEVGWFFLISSSAVYKAKLHPQVVEELGSFRCPGCVVSDHSPPDQLPAQPAEGTGGCRHQRSPSCPSRLPEASLDSFSGDSRSHPQLPVCETEKNHSESETVTLLRLMWICSCKRMLKVPLLYRDRALPRFSLFSAFFGIKSSDKTFNFILVHEHLC